MCGIAAIYGNFGNKSDRRILIQKMISSLQHRGPDGWGFYLSPQIVFGHTRLSIVDLERGSQPMFFGDYAIIYNGEIFNYIELKAELEEKGVSFDTTCDTEVLLKTFITFGPDCFEKLNGQFAVLIWNRVKKELVAARDRFAIRPLYFTKFDGQYYFSSEMKAFDKIPGYQRKFQMQHLFQHALLWNTCGSNTVFEGIESLPSGTYAIFRDGKLIENKSYYELGQSHSQNFNSYEEAQEAFVELMEDAVRLRLRGDVPVGAYLSGGIDSSVILSLISKHISNDYKTFSITFNDRDYDESQYQREMVKMIDTDHHSIDITYDSVDEAFPNAVYHFERPVFRTAPVPLYLLSDVVRDNKIKVVLTGEGADEILWGYDAYKEIKLLEFWSKYPESELRPLLIKKLYPHLNHYKDDTQYGMIRMFYEEFLGEVNNELASLNIRLHNNKILQNYFEKSHGIKYEQNSFIEGFKKYLPEDYNKWSILQRSQYLEMKTLLAGYLLSSQGDRMSMAHSVEGRYPFLDHRLVDMLFFMNESYKLNGFEQKYILKRAYAKEIPESIVNRPKRPYMSPDLRSFIRGNKLTENASFFLSESLIKEYQIFNQKWVTRFLNKFNDGLPGNLSYRDNMIITFILSTQIANYWAKNPRDFDLPEELLTVQIEDY